MMMQCDCSYSNESKKGRRKNQSKGIEIEIEIEMTAELSRVATTEQIDFQALEWNIIPTGTSIWLPDWLTHGCVGVVSMTQYCRERRVT
jgi:hypothetical protein